MFAVHVDGGTGAGSKRPLLPANTIPWRCGCEIQVDLGGGNIGPSGEKKRNPGYLRKCIDCGTRRDPS